MRKQIILLTAFILCSFLSWGQHNKDGTFELEMKITIWFQNSRGLDSVVKIGKIAGPSEAIFCLLDVDSSGSISNIHFLADNQNKDSAYAIITQLTPADLKEWKHEEYKGKTLIMPLVFLNDDSKNDPKYVHDLSIRKLESEKLIIGRTVYIRWPLCSICETPNTIQTVEVK